MEPGRRPGMGFMPSIEHHVTHQPRRALAINEMLNHGSPPLRYELPQLPQPHRPLHPIPTLPQPTSHLPRAQHNLPDYHPIGLRPRGTIRQESLPEPLDTYPMHTDLQPLQNHDVYRRGTTDVYIQQERHLGPGQPLPRKWTCSFLFFVPDARQT